MTKTLENSLTLVNTTRTCTISVEYNIHNLLPNTDIHKQSELPTLLHFAAKYGLEQLCITLLTFPGGRHALKIKNNNGKTPYKLAIAGEFTHLADNILVSKELLMTFIK